MFKHILLATDFSTSALLAAAAASDLAAAFDARVTLLTVVDPETEGGAAQGREFLAVLRDERFKGLEVDLVAVESDRPSLAICDKAKNLGVDLVVAGRHGEHSLSEKVIGSTTERVARMAPCSVLVTHPTQRNTIFSIKHLLIGTDFSEESTPAVSAGGAIARALETGVTLMHVYDLFPPVELLQGPHSEDGNFRELLEDKLEEARKEHLDGLPVSNKLLRDKSTVTAICDWADDHRVDLVVLGTHGLTGIKRLLLGSIAERVIRHAPCSVMIVRR